MKDWKKSERRIARILGGERVPVTGRQRGRDRVATPDVEHPRLSIEVKSRASYPAWLEDAMRQAEAAAMFPNTSGTPGLPGSPGKIPVAVLHRDGHRYADDLVIVRLSDFAEMFTGTGDVSRASERKEGR